MLHVSFLSVPSISIQEFLPGAHLTCALLVLAVLSRFVILPTWQRSLSSAKSLLIQGSGRWHRFENDTRVIMETKEDESKRVPVFDGKLDQYRDYRKRALLYLNGLEDNKQSLAAPRLISNLTGPAFECFRERDPANFRNDNGVLQMLAVLDERYQFTPEQELSDKLEDLFFRLRRRRGEETTSFTTRFETLLSKTEDLISEEQKVERRKQQDLLKAEFRRQSLDYMVSRQQHDAQVAALGEGEVPPPEPVAPSPPQEIPVPPAFRFPEAMKGFLYLRHIGISLQTRSSLLRSSGGSLRYDKVAELLRRTELDALVASRSQGQGHQGHSYWADGPDDEQLVEEDEWTEEEVIDGDDEFGAYAEEGESEDVDEADLDEAAGDEDYDAAMIGYLEARQKLLGLRKSRGFREPAEPASSHRTISGRPEQERRDDRREGRGRPLPTGRKSDFGWRDRERDRDRRASSSRHHQNRRPRTPPPTKRKGQGKGKKKGVRSSSGGRRNEPTGSQYLGMAVTNSARTPIAPSMTKHFEPEFSFMAFPSQGQASASGDGASDFPHGCFVSRHALRPVESMVEECLVLDELLGLIADESAQSCCLVTPPGYAILDTGCTSTLVGADNERLWRLELEKRSQGELKPERSESDVKFEGINGETRASYKVKYPVRIGSKSGYVEASVIPGKAPFLLSIQALRAMKAKLDCEHDVLEIPGIGKVRLEVNSVGHYLLPLLDFSDGHAFASAEADFGPESELVVDDSLPRQGVGPSEPPGLEGSRAVGHTGKVTQTSPDQGQEHVGYVPRYQAVANRTDKYAVGALVRLAKDTKGPWVALPKELPAVYLILGKHGFMDQGSERKPWQVRAAQIGYRARVVRRPPPQLRDGWVAVLSLDDRCLRLAVDWQKCADCVGDPLPKPKSDSAKWLFVFALPPEVPKDPEVDPHAKHLGVESDAAFTAVHVCFDMRTSCMPEGTSASESSPESDSCEEFFDCYEPVEVCLLDGSRPGAGPSVCSLSGALCRDIQQCDGDNLPLQCLPQPVSHLQGSDGTLHQRQWQGRVCSASRLCSYAHPRTKRANTFGRRRSGQSPGWGNHHRQGWPHSLPIRCPADCLSCSSSSSSSGTRGSSRISKPDSIRYRLDGSDSEGDQGCGECRCDDPWYLWHDETGADDSCAKHSNVSSIRSTGNPTGRARDAGKGVQSVSCAAGCDHDTQAGPRADQGDGGTGCRAYHPCRSSTSNCRASTKSTLREADPGEDGEVNGIQSNTGRSSIRRSGHPRSRLSSILGGLAAALTATSIVEPSLPTMPIVNGHESADVSGESSWPRLSPEVEIPPLDGKADLSLPQAWKAVPVNFERNASRARLREWLGPQGWKLGRGIQVQLIEVFAGRARLSDEWESAGGTAIRLGHAWGQELRGEEARWLVRSLVQLVKPRDLFVAFPCVAHCRWNQFNVNRSLETRQKIMRERLASGSDLHMLFELLDCQSSSGRHLTAENPKGSLAWQDSRFRRLRCTHFFSTVHQCALGLRHPKSGMPIRKSTTIFTTRPKLAKYVISFRCKGDHDHDHLAGTFMGKSVTAWAEDYPKKMARALVTGMLLPQVPRFGQAGDPEVSYEPSPRFEGHFGREHVVPAFYANGSVRDFAFPGASTEPTIFKVTDENLHKQLNALQFPGRYKRDELPIPIRAQLLAWSGLEVDTVVTARSLKCYMNLPTAVVATRRTTLARVGGEWHYLDHCFELPNTQRRLRLPVNCQLVVTFFGDKPQSSDPQAAEAQPQPKAVPGQQDIRDPRKVHEYLQRLHVGLGHPGTAELLQHLKDAGAATWLLRQAQRFTCSVCDAHRPLPPRSVIGGPKPRSFNSIVSVDTLDLTLERDGVQYRTFLLTAVDSATSYARAFHLSTGDSMEAVKQFGGGWLEAYGAPDFVFSDPDTVFRAEEFSRFLSRNSIIQRLSAAQSPWQHGQVERLHRTIRQQSERVFQADRQCSPFEAVVAVLQARNELMRVEGVSPAVLVFGKLPKTPPNFAESDEDYDLLADRLQREDPLYESIMLRRVAARTAWVQSEVRDRTSRALATRPRPYKGPYYKGQAVLVYRRRKGDASNPGHKGVWLGPGEVVAAESTSDKLVPRVVYVTVHGRLFLCSPEQLRPISLKAEWVRSQLPLMGAEQQSFQEMRTARGTDVRGERPSSAELESLYEEPEPKVEQLAAESEYEPLPQGPPTPAPGTPVGTPSPGTPRPPVSSAAQPLLDSNVVPVIPPTPDGGDDFLASLGGDREQAQGTTKRGGKRPAEGSTEFEQLARSRAVPHHKGESAQPAPSLAEPSSSTTVLTGAEQVGVRGRSRTPSRNPKPRNTSFWAFSDFEGQSSDHVSDGWYEGSQDHEYVGTAIGLEFDVDLEEIHDDESIAHIVREMCWSAAASQKRRFEVVERSLTPEEKTMFREAKHAEWSQWVSNDVVELISRRGIDPKRIISSRWVLTWKAVDGGPPDSKRPKARLVIRGFRDPDLGEFSTASPTLSRQGRHAVLTVAAHYQYRVFTLDAKTAFLSGDRSSRVKPIYAELPKDLVRDQGYDPETIARIKKVPYGLSEAPLAWFRRLTAELISSGFEVVPADRCIYVLRDRNDRSRVLGVIGAHVDDLLIAGCSSSVDPQFEDALQHLMSRLPFGDRKYADVSPVLYTGLNLRQHPQTREISVDQDHYIAKLREVPVKRISDGVLDKQGQTLFWSQLGALLWVAVNTRPDVAYDVSHYASYGKHPERQHIVALNKIVRSLQSTTCTLKFRRLADRWEDLTLVVFSDAGHTSRPSGHSQAGTMMFWAPRTVLEGHEAPAVLADFSSCKIDRAVWSSYASELQAATIASDSAVSILLLYEQLLFGLKAKEVKEKLTSVPYSRVLVTDNKGLYDSIQTEKPSTRQGQKMQSLVYQILYDLVVDYGFQTYWVNAEHMLADGLTKLSGSGGRIDLIRDVLEHCRVRITYCTVSGRRERQASKHKLEKLVPVTPADVDLHSSIDV